MVDVCVFIVENVDREHWGWWHRWQRICPQSRRFRFDPWVRKMPWRKEWLPTLIFLPRESHGQRSLVGYSPWGRKELDITEQLSKRAHTCAHTHTHTHTHPNIEQDRGKKKKTVQKKKQDTEDKRSKEVTHNENSRRPLTVGFGSISTKCQREAT